MTKFCDNVYLIEILWISDEKSIKSKAWMYRNIQLWFCWFSISNYFAKHSTFAIIQFNWNIDRGCQVGHMKNIFIFCSVFFSYFIWILNDSGFFFREFEKIYNITWIRFRIESHLKMIIKKFHNFMLFCI